MTTLERLRALLAEGTPGPWHRHTYGHRSVRAAAGAVTSALFKNKHTDLSYVHADTPDGEGPSICLTGNGPKQTDNAALIAAAVNALPSLLDMAEAARFDHSAHRLVDCRGCAALDRLEGAS